jgi:DNA integrity scanning protein DisA with diadenylate cyclase activity
MKLTAVHVVTAMIIAGLTVVFQDELRRVLRRVGLS